jgi:phosphopantetheine--protein transferase-like protein
MSRYDSNLLSDYFAANSRDLTPASVRHVTRLLYMPVSTDREVTRRCASILSDSELERADRFAIQGDRTLFKQRRAFGRFCGALALGSPQPLSQIVFDATEKGRPHLSALPNFHFSFSACQFGFLGAWSATHGIGVDLEDHTRTLEPVELAQRFFSVAEARVVKGPCGLASLRTFFRLWSLKEAALKSIGEGLPYGLDNFEFELEPDLRVVNAPDNFGGRAQFDPHLIEITDCSVALVIRSLA